MKLLRPSAAALVAASIALSSCASVTGGALIRKGEQPATLVIRNTSGVGIDVVTLSRCSALSYGLNRLGGSQSEIPNNSSMSFTIGAGCWDLMVGRTGTCTHESCNWLQSPANRFTIAPGQRQVITYGRNL
ncbi:hypothetical protein OF829_16460 [Sphingomonas sp. LB-2]|uniref:hypothetical protein n=1 Tax=Sphingomonas caeni TaxID=2984949 RepID=UPI00222F4850|nr:hypothetical protein [Sphingomonas caeni]MCW3848831.1 hypothetical protein [Sphingomonas caeni]